jgi:hypothetical protein
MHGACVVVRSTAGLQWRLYKCGIGTAALIACNPIVVVYHDPCCALLATDVHY